MILQENNAFLPVINCALKNVDSVFIEYAVQQNFLQNMNLIIHIRRDIRE